MTDEGHEKQRTVD